MTASSGADRSADAAVRPAFDYIIVGAGSAGCALANRLTEDPQCRVLLLESGPGDYSPYIQIPAALIRAIGNPKLDWCYMADPDPTRAGRQDMWHAGRVLGGSSAINGMLYVRGAPHDFDNWAAAGCEGWSFAEVSEDFRRLESTPFGDADERGRDGPIRVEGLRSPHRLAGVFVEAALAAGIPWNDDYNSGSQEGIGEPQVTQRRGRRWSAAQGYLRPIRGRRNLEIRTHTTVERLVFSDRRCIGVEILRRGKREVVHAARETLVCAGAIGTPLLLMRSGIGPAADLQALGIEVLVDSPEVGENLCEHPNAMISIDVRERTYNTEINSSRMALHLTNWLLRRRGPATSPFPHSVGFVRSQPDLPAPDLQIMLGPYAFALEDGGVVPYLKPAVSAVVTVSYPRSRGRITLRSPDPQAAPRIFHPLLADDADIDALIRGGELCRQLFANAVFDHTRLGERLPGSKVQSREEWVDYLRQAAFLGNHPIGTCRMGGDAGSVVDPQLRVRGIGSLRVVDASIMPTPISGNTNAAAMMIGERGAVLIRTAQGGV
ncbi:MAG: GMC family oxidoreductase N-terminal domain-containing protein [Gammaproteobacteria bacterium]|nr:GMC family oxidoreductase N-terminal domain-containing protein [Gammaproteobacteria bacterium]